LTWNRQTYSTLDYLGDLGGLFNGLKAICGVLIFPLIQSSFMANLLEKFFHSRLEIVQAEEDEKNKAKISQ